MKRRGMSLKTTLILTVSAITLVLIGFYAVLSVSFYLRGMDNLIAADMESAVRALDNPAITGPLHDGTDWISADWEGLPETIRQHVNSAPSEDEVLQVTRVKDRLTRGPQRIIFTMRVPRADTYVFVARVLSRETASPLVGRNVRYNQTLLISVVIATLVSLAVLFWWLFRRFARPVRALESWTRQLNPQTIQQPLPDFDYPELNSMASLIRQSLKDVQDSLDREQRFLGHASHELRTPISVIRSNVGLLRKLQSQQDRPDPKLLPISERIDRASLTMKHLTETLLWLSRDQAVPPGAESISLSALVEEQLQELDYLRTGKPVEVELHVENTLPLCLPQVPTQIVISNLIRNALQHTESGTIRISLNASTLCVENPLPDGTSVKGSGFGLGLQLTRQLCERLGWNLRRVTDESHYHVVLLLVETR